MLKSSKVFSTVLATAMMLTIFAGAVGAAQPKKAKPKRKPQPSGIELPKNITKDKLICFALYTVSNGILKMNAQLSFVCWNLYQSK